MANTEVRVAALVEKLRETLGKDELFARAGAAAVWHLILRSSKGVADARQSTPLMVSSECWAVALAEATPRNVPFESNEHTVLVFIDGCYVPESGEVRAGIGAVLLDARTGVSESFGMRIPKRRQRP